MHSMRYRKAALKALRRMPAPQARKLVEALSEIAKDPSQPRGSQWKPMKGQEFWRLRQGSYRALCRIDDGELVILVLKVGPRGDIYK
ncbi:type II toxin-antitoxin system RelE/ParE family toxin [Aquisalimonas sp. 2447]|nr:type II toxin-antitoxin system RelE/ParE family toxin [Aquisalimonas sp. 2447]